MTYKISEGVWQELFDQGFTKDDEAEIMTMLENSVPYTHALVNRRFEDHGFFVSGDRVVTYIPLTID